MQDFLSRTHRVEALLGRFRRALLRELLQAYPDVDYFDRTDLVEVLAPGAFAPYTGFTADEVESLCEHYHMDFTLAKQWYDGYAFPDAVEIYNPRSVVTAMLQHRFGTYWNQTETFEALRVYIDLNLDGLRDAIIRLLAGDSLKINTGTFGNDMTTFHTADDVLTLFVHFGYLAYDEEQGEVHVANREVMLEFISAVSVSGWEEVMRSIKASAELLQATWNCQADIVADKIAAAHLETSQLTYNDENALSYTLSLAYYAAREYYQIVREMPAGKGFADLAFLPRQNHLDKPAMLVELKWNHSAETAIRQIKERQYPNVFSGYAGRILLVGISYERKTKQHTCKIEWVE